MDNEVYGDEPTELDCNCPECAEVMPAAPLMTKVPRSVECTCWKCDGTHTCPDCLRDTL